MEDYYGGPAWVRPALPPAPRRRGARWLLIGGLALAFVLTLGVGALLGSTLLRTAQAANLASGGGNVVDFASGPGDQDVGRFPLAATPGAQQQCAALTVSSVSGQTIVAKTASGSTVTIHTTSSTQYTRDGQSATASAVTVGAQIRVVGTNNSDGSITATHIDIK